ncbi:hypothetical protein ACQP00_21360 [Dactylosporangium sp. CS-047395]|uniref:hypothetical protein n=1 Tax=Dactylosporangium sp. CS-047395 TaxID=3239936 RepID=UPI003D8B64CA
MHPYLMALHDTWERSDSRFVAGLRRGVPVAPIEYRSALTSTLRLACVVVQVLALIAGSDLGVVAAGVLALVAALPTAARPPGPGPPGSW